MYWNKATDKMPENGQEVLVRLSSTVSLTIYSEEKGFVAKSGETFPARLAGLQWLSLNDSEPALSHPAKRLV